MASGIEFWYWLVLGVILITVEMFVPGAFFLGMGVAAASVGVLMWLFSGLGVEFQILCFAVLSLISIVVLRKLIKARPIKSDKPLLNQRGQQYVGRHFTLQEPVVNGQGKIRVDDSTWKIRGDDCAAGTTVTVTGVDGVVLTVQLKK